MIRKASTAITTLLPAAIVLTAGWLLVGSVGRATAAPPTGPSSAPSAQAVLDAARQADAAGDNPRVIELIQEWLKTQPANESTAEAFYLIGRAAWRQQQADDAVFYLRKLMQDAPHSPWVADASALLGQIFMAQGSTGDAINYLEKAVGLQTEPQLRRPLYEQLLGLYRKTGRLLKSVETLLALRRLAESAGDAEALAGVNQQMRDMIDGATDPEQLTHVAVAITRRFPADLVLLRLADLAGQRHEPFEEEQWLRRFLTEFPKQPQSGEVSDRLRAMAAAVKAKPSVVGVLLPLSGPAQLFGRSALRGVEVAWEAASSIGLAIRDSQSGEGSLERWIDESHPLAIIGPLLNREVDRLLPLARRARLPVMSPGATGGMDGASDASTMLRDRQNDLFRNGLTLEQQARTAADYAVNRLTAKRIVILYPEEPYGRTLKELFSTELIRLGGEVIASVGYARDATDFSAQLRAVKAADLARYGTVGPSVEGKPPNQWPYTPGFDAILLPGDAEQVGMIASQLAFHGIEHIPLIGMGGWNRPELLTFGGRFIEGAVFVDGFFAGNESPPVKEFVRRYRMRYHEEPDLFAAQAYDAARMVIGAIEQGAKSGEQVRDYLSGIKLYPGVSGATTLVPGGPAQKQLFIITIQGGKFVQVN